MQVDSIEIFHVALPLLASPSPRAASRESGTRIGPETLQTVLLRMQSGQSVGWGEASPGNAPTASPEWAAGAFACLRDWLAPAVAGTVVDCGDDLQDRLGGFHGNRFAKAALDMAWWDLYARLQGQPLSKVLGGTRHTVQIGASFDEMVTINELLEAIGRALDAKPNFTYPADLFPSEQFLRQDLVAPPQSDLGGPDGKRQVTLGPEPGIGIEPDAELLDKFCLDRATVPCGDDKST